MWWFWPKECNINPFNGDPALCGPFDQNSVAVVANVVPTGQFDQKPVTICGHSRCGRFGVEPFWLGPQVLTQNSRLRCFMKSCSKTSYCLVNKGSGSDQLPFHTIQIEWNDKFWYKIDTLIVSNQTYFRTRKIGLIFLGGLWNLRPSNISVLRKKTIKVAVLPCSLILWSKPCFCYLIRKFAFLWGKIMIHKQQCTRMCRGWLVSRGGRKVQLVRRACMPTIHWCVWNCRVSAQWFNTAMLPSIKRWGIISAMILFYLLWIHLEISLVFHYVNLPKGEVLMTFCVSTLTL